MCTHKPSVTVMPNTSSISLTLLVTPLPRKTCHTCCCRHLHILPPVSLHSRKKQHDKHTDVRGHKQCEAGRNHVIGRAFPGFALADLKRCSLMSLANNNLSPPAPTTPQMVIDLVMGTDMKQHFSIVSHFTSVHRLTPPASIAAAPVGDAGACSTRASTHSGGSRASPNKASHGKPGGTRTSPTKASILTTPAP